MVTKSEIISLLSTAAPEWEPDVDDPLYLQLGSLGRYIVASVERGQIESLGPVFDAVERLHIDGDGFTREAATIGILESIQSNAEHRQIPLATFEPLLRPETRLWWDRLIAFWEGRSPIVG